MLIRHKDKDIDMIAENLTYSIDDPSCRDELADAEISKSIWSLLEQLSQNRKTPPTFDQIRKNRWVQGPVACPEAVMEYLNLNVHWHYIIDIA